MNKQSFLKPSFYQDDLTHRTKRIANAIRQVHNDIINQVGECFSPFFIVADELPEKRLVEEKLLRLREQAICPGKVIIVITEPGGLNSGAEWQMMQTGIKDIYCWAGEDDFKDYLLHTMQRGQKVSTILEAGLVKDNLIGESPVWKNFLSKLIEAALFSQCSFLLTGESGTGKELISRLIHTIDTRQDKQELVLVDCTTIVPELSGSEFFGHERGS